MSARPDGAVQGTYSGGVAILIFPFPSPSKTAAFFFTS
jgi:hypothetical protein